MWGFVKYTIKMCQCLQNLHSSANQYLWSNWFLMSQNCALIKKQSIWLQGRTFDFNVNNYEKYIDKVSDCTLKLTFRNYCLSFLVQHQKTVSIFTWKDYWNISPFSNYRMYETRFCSYNIVQPTRSSSRFENPVNFC